MPQQQLRSYGDGMLLKVSSNRLEKLRIHPTTPCLQEKWLYLYATFMLFCLCVVVAEKNIKKKVFKTILTLTHFSLASFLWDIGKQYSPRCDAAERGVPSGAILFAQSNFIEKLNKN